MISDLNELDIEDQEIFDDPEQDVTTLHYILQLKNAQGEYIDIRKRVAEADYVKT